MLYGQNKRQKLHLLFPTLWDREFGTGFCRVFAGVAEISLIQSQEIEYYPFLLEWRKKFWPNLAHPSTKEF